MENRSCEVVGCCRPAAWIRAAEAITNLEEALCSHCWASLRYMKPQSAMLYTPCENATSFSELTTAVVFSENDCEEAIYIS